MRWSKFIPEEDQNLFILHSHYRDCHTSGQGISSHVIGQVVLEYSARIIKKFYIYFVNITPTDDLAMQEDRTLTHMALSYFSPEYQPLTRRDRVISV